MTVASHCGTSGSLRGRSYRDWPCGRGGDCSGCDTCRDGGSALGALRALGAVAAAAAPILATRALVTAFALTLALALAAAAVLATRAAGLVA